MEASPPHRRSAEELRADALAIWQAGLRAVDSARLVREHVRVAGHSLTIGDWSRSLDDIRHIAVVGAGKAGAGMAEGLEAALSGIAASKQLHGWINVPADCVRPLHYLRLHAARPAGVNEPTEAGVLGSQRILDIVRGLEAGDLCLCLLSGGGSALLPAPVPAITLADKQAVTRHLGAAGANIEELNTVRKQLSQIKGGGLARACRAGTLITLIISDVLGDPLDVIASGPTVPDTRSAADALAVLERFQARQAGISPAVFAYLEQAARRPPQHRQPITCETANLIIGNNAVAVEAAGIEAERREYSHAMLAATRWEGNAEDVGRHLAEMALRMRDQPGPDCLITGGEPTVQLVDAAQRGLGGRNQQLVLAALIRLLEAASDGNPLRGIALLSGGTDGEDGPTDAAGAYLDEAIAAALQQSALDPREFLRRNDAYHFFAALDALLKTGPTHTNVCDVRVVCVSPAAG